MKLARWIFIPMLMALITTVVAQQQDGSPPSKPQRDVRFVVVHTPGPKWDSSKSLFEQVGIQDHIDHYRKLLEQGKLELGGPFMDGRAGGMMIPTAGVTEEEIRRFSLDDPAVKSGLLQAEVRPWLVGMHK